MSTATVQELQANFLGVLDRLQPGEELAVTDGQQTVARVTKGDFPSPAKAGCYAKPGFHMAADFNAPLDDFKAYME